MMNTEWQTQAMRLVNKVQYILKDMGYDSYLGYGTLLGVVREGKLIEHDDDIDIIILFKDNKNIINNYINLLWKFKEIGLLSKVFMKNYYLFEDSIASKEQIKYPTGQAHLKGYGVTIDLWLDWVEDENYINGCFGSFGEVYKYFPLDQVTYNNHNGESYSLSIPNNAQIMLEYIYGKEWIKSIKNQKRGEDLAPRHDYLLDKYDVLI